MIGRQVGALAPFGRARSTLQGEAVFHSASHEVRWVKINWVGGTARSVKNFKSFARLDLQYCAPEGRLGAYPAPDEGKRLRRFLILSRNE